MGKRKPQISRYTLRVNSIPFNQLSDADISDSQKLAKFKKGFYPKGIISEYNNLVEFEKFIETKIRIEFLKTKSQDKALQIFGEKNSAGEREDINALIDLFYTEEKRNRF